MKVGIIGLGYVGVQLAVALGKRLVTVGFDPDETKINSYKAGIDQTGEVLQRQFESAHKTIYTTNINICE